MGLIIVDHDRKIYAFTGIINDDRPWNNRIAEKQGKGRNITCFSHKPSNNHILTEWEQRNGLTRRTIEEILYAPEESYNSYEGPVHTYEYRVDRKRLVKMLCRGGCSQTQRAQLNKVYLVRRHSGMQ